MRISNTYISLKRPEHRNIAIRGLPLVHEAAHWKHTDEDSRSSEWIGKFFSASHNKSGYLTGHSRLNYLVSSPPWIPNKPTGIPFRQFVGGILVESYGTVEDMDALVRTFEVMPTGLMVFDHVRIEPDLNGPGYMSGVHPSREYSMVTEDIAGTTEWAYVVFTVPQLVRDKLKRIDGSPVLQAKINLLGKWGFIEPAVANQLLDSKWRTKMLELGLSCVVHDFELEPDPRYPDSRFYPSYA
ncbi:MAG: hypothetical protein WCT31_00730 [Candidatus Micrarchaeia archaeon]|jgi:hypothetical protein